MPKPGLFLFIFVFSHDKHSANLTINEKQIDGVLGTQTWDVSMVSANKPTELWRQPLKIILTSANYQVQTVHQHFLL